MKPRGSGASWLKIGGVSNGETVKRAGDYKVATYNSCCSSFPGPCSYSPTVENEGRQSFPVLLKSGTCYRRADGLTSDFVRLSGLSVAHPIVEIDFAIAHCGCGESELRLTASSHLQPGDTFPSGCK